MNEKNPYLYKAKGTQNATEIITDVLSAYLTSSDETIFGDAFFEPLAREVGPGVVGHGEGFDIAIETENRFSPMSLKSGPNPHSSSQSRKQNEEFISLKARLAKIGKEFDPVLGHAYGRKQTPAGGKRIYRHSSGQRLWEEITGDPDFYLKIIRLMDDKFIQERREEYKAEFDKAINRYVREFTIQFCREDGSIDWEKLVIFNSGSGRRPRSSKKKAAEALPFAPEPTSIVEGKTES